MARSSAPAFLLCGLASLAMASGCGSAESTGVASEAAVVGNGVTGTLTFQSDWGAGYCANVTVTNTGATTSTGWTAVIALNQSTVSSFWSATDVVTGGQVTAAALSWNAAIAPGASTTFGFCGNATGTNYRPALTSIAVTGNGGTSSASTSTASTASSSTATTSRSSASTTASSSGSTGTTTTATRSSASTTATRSQSSTRASSSTATTSSSSASSSNGCAATGGTQSGGTQFCSNSQGTVPGGGYTYQLWSNGQGTGCMTVFGTNADFKANWSNAGDFLARVGLGFNETKTPSQIGTLSADFAETKSGTASFSDIGVYGWSVNPLHEYYIVEDWFGNRPIPGTKMGTITVDGGAYDVYTHTQTNQPAITGGNATFVQFLSVRQTPRQCGHISISEHFSQWASLGMQLGELEEARILLEAGGNATGTIDFTNATVTLQ